MEKRFHPAGREEWRAWLRDNHADADEVWLVYYKAHTGKPSVSYRESVEEALCFGWIDGIRKSIDDGRYCHRFSPRRAKSKWSPLNIELARKMIAQGRMTPAGQACFERREEYAEAFLRAREQPVFRLTREMERALKDNPPAWDNFKRLAPGYRKQYAAWLVSAKKPETRAKRLAEAIALLRENRKLGMK
jgi:uncharacterized protein YdeI (YjbR/CyaY-like superfamily)